ncbi:MAG: ESS family glutamate:Na+ symporter [Myxococcota bacterium]|jgi:ESS family glutamate:Na+ symporter
MQFWSGPLVDLLVLFSVLGLVGLLWSRVPALASLGVPVSMVAGLVALALGPSGLEAVPFDVGTLEAVVYHGLALVFVTFGLMPPQVGARITGDARSMMLAIPALAVLQGVLGLSVVLLFTAAGDPLHPGFGLALPLAFSQGPGQALSIGRTWEAAGMLHGGQVGLTMAAVGYLWCVLVGVPFVRIGRRLGWADVSPATVIRQAVDERVVPPGPGELDPLSRHVALVAAVYFAVFLLLHGLETQIAAERPRAMLWGFHFLFGVFIAIGVRRLLGVMGVTLDRAVLRRMGGLLVDAVTCAAIGAIQIAIVGAYAVPILVICVVGGGMTLLACIWLARRAFREDPFAHAVALFGLSTGTLPTGLALLRAHDPELRSPAATNLVLGATGAIVPGIPLLLFLIPMPIVGWPESFPVAVFQTLGAMAAYLAVLGALWWGFGGLRGLTAPRLWASDEDVAPR